MEDQGRSSKNQKRKKKEAKEALKRAKYKKRKKEREKGIKEPICESLQEDAEMAFGCSNGIPIIMKIPFEHEV